MPHNLFHLVSARLSKLRNCNIRKPGKLLEKSRERATRRLAGTMVGMNFVKRLCVVIINYRTPELAIACMQSMEEARAAFPDLQAIVVDGGSNDQSVQLLTAAMAADGRQGWTEFLPLAINGGFGYANNQALLTLASRGPLPEYVALINPDARVLPGALEAMVAVLDREPRCGAVGGLLVHDDGSSQSSAFRFPSVRGEFCRGARTGFVERLLGHSAVRVELEQAGPVPWATGAAVMFRTTALAQTGLFDDGFFLYFEETELMHRLRQKGWVIWHEPRARVVHEGGAATQIRDPKTGNPFEKPMPRYWYEARKRYFALTGGRAYALAAGLAWLGGHVFWTFRRIITRLPASSTERAVRDMIAYGLWPSRGDSERAVQSFSGPVSQRPAWMKNDHV